MTTITPFRITVILGEKPVAQVESLERYLDDQGNPVTSKLLPAENLAMPLSEEILGNISSGLLAKVQSSAADIADGKQKSQDAIQAIQDKSTQDLSDALKRIAELSAENAILAPFESQLAYLQQKFDVASADNSRLQDLHNEALRLNTYMGEEVAKGTAPEVILLTVIAAATEKLKPEGEKALAAVDVELAALQAKRNTLADNLAQTKP